jgi:GNAT superfamily N-acetyltransferase
MDTHGGANVPEGNALVGRDGDFERLVRRLSTASERGRISWEDALAEHHWEHDGRQVLHRLPDWDPLRDAPHLQGDLSEDAAGLQRALAYFRAGIALETILRIGLVPLAESFPAGHPAREYIAWEIAEEEQHSAMFAWFCDLAGPGLPHHPAIEDEELERLSRFGREEPAIFVLHVLLGEMAFDRIQRTSLATPDNHPLVAHIHRIHVLEEARHLSFGRALLRHQLRTATPRLRRRLAYEAPFVARWTCDLVMDVPPALHRALGATDDEITEARETVRRSAIYRQSLAEQHRLCASFGLVDPRLGRVWGVDVPDERG